MDEKISIQLTHDKIKEYSNDNILISLIKKKYRRITPSGAKKLIGEILKSNLNIHISSIKKKYTGFLQYNKSKFDENLNLNIEEIKIIRLILLDIISKQEREFEIIDEPNNKISELLNKYSKYFKVRQHIEKNLGDVNFYYDFNNPDLKVTPPLYIDTLQRCEIQVTGIGTGWDYPLEYVYNCSEERCSGLNQRRFPFQTASTNNKIKCTGIRDYIKSNGEWSQKECRLDLKPDVSIAKTKKCYYYDILFENAEGQTESAGAISFNNYNPGFYECVLFKIANPKGLHSFHIIDIKEINENDLIIPEKKDDENFIFTLQQTVDKFIKKQSGMELYGLLPIKIALLLQSLCSCLDLDKYGNIQVVGDPSTGKSLILKYYGYLLNSHMHLSTNGVSISVPALRGTRDSVTLLGKDISINTHGYLGIFNTIHIDEAGEDRVLVQHLKTFLYETNYGYNKAGSFGIIKKRKSFINLSENLDYHHLGIYTNSIRKAYKDSNLKIGDEPKIEWNEEWDLHLPLYKYIDNPYLMKVVKEKREDFYKKSTFWIDGYDQGLHERFPFYFLLVNREKNEKLMNIIKGNISRNTIKENLELTRVLKTNNLKKFFMSLKNYIIVEDEEQHFGRVDDILETYGLKTSNGRIRQFYYSLLKYSRILNKRITPNEQDYNLVKWFIEMIGRKLDISETVDVKIAGPPNMEKYNKQINDIVDSVQNSDDNNFGVSGDDFDEL